MLAQFICFFKATSGSVTAKKNHNKQTRKNNQESQFQTLMKKRSEAERFLTFFWAGSASWSALRAGTGLCLLCGILRRDRRCCLTAPRCAVAPCRPGGEVQARSTTSTEESRQLFTSPPLHLSLGHLLGGADLSLAAGEISA